MNTLTERELNPLALPYTNPKAHPGNNIVLSLDDTTRLIKDCINPDGSIHPSIIKSIKMTLTNACNLECRHCGRNKEAPPIIISFERFKEIADQVIALGIKKFGLFFDGNSTLAADRLCECVEYLAAQGIYVFLTDNATSAHPKTVERLLRGGISSIKWSMNANFDTYEELVGCKPHMLQIALRNIREAYKLREKVYGETELDCGLYASSILFDEDQPKKMRPFLEEHVFPHVDQHYWLKLYSMGGEEAVTNMKEIAEPTRGNTGRYGDIRPAMPCWAVVNAIHIAFGPGFDGENGPLHLYSCCFPTNQEGHVMADLGVTPLAEAINSEKFKALRLRHLHNEPIGTPCEGCVTGNWKS